MRGLNLKEIMSKSNMNQQGLNIATYGQAYLSLAVNICQKKIFIPFLYKSITDTVDTYTLFIFQNRRICQLAYKHFSFCQPLFLVYIFQITQEITNNLYKSCSHHSIHNYVPYTFNSEITLDKTKNETPLQLIM